MFLFYLFACVPVAIGFLLWWQDKNVVWQEWLGGSAAAFLVAVIFHLIAAYGMTGDIETWSGQVSSARQFSRWKEYYEYAVYRTEYYYTTETYYTTDSKGRSQSHTRRVQHSRQVFDHWQPTSRWHNESWEVYTTLGDWGIDKLKYKEICRKFNDEHAVVGTRTTGEHNSRMLEGDPNDYVADNRTGWIEPVTTTRSFENKVKASPSVFSFIKVPTNVFVYQWPKTTNPFRSNRLLGKASLDFNLLKFDQMNARLGPTKRVNVIIINFGYADSMIAEYQRAAWVGGKKNDLVICYARDWVRVFGWTESELVKENLQTILLKNKKNDDLLPLIEQEINKNYKIKDWHKFDYLTIEPRTSHYIWFIIILIITQGGLYTWFHMNEYVQGKNAGTTVEDWDRKRSADDLIARIKDSWRSLLDSYRNR